MEITEGKHPRGWSRARPEYDLPVRHGADCTGGKAAVAHEMRMYHRAEPWLTGHVGGRGVRGWEGLAREPGDERGAWSSGAIQPANLFGADDLGFRPAMVHGGNFETRERNRLRRQSSGQGFGRRDRGLVAKE
jgi:hypothetical protein